MKKILDLMEGQLRAAFSACGYDETFAKVVLSNRPDLCEYQCNGSMAAAKAYRKKPIDIANGVVEQLGDGQGMFSMGAGRDAGIYQFKALGTVPGGLHEGDGRW